MFFKASVLRRSKHFLILFCLFSLPSCTTGPEPVLRVATNVWPGYESLYLARSLGFYDKSPIRLVEMTSASQVSHAFRNGTVEAAALTLDETLGLMQDGGIDLRVVLVMDISDGADVLLADARINNLQGLRGKRVGVENTATGAVVLDAALQSAGLNAKDVTIVPMTVNDHLSAWKSGEIDAVVTFEPVRSALLNLGGRELFNSSQIPGRILDVLVVRADALESHRSALKTLISGYFAALGYLTQYPQDAAARIAPRMAVDDQQVLSQFKGLKLPSLEDNRKWLSGSAPLLFKSAADLSSLMREHQLLQTEIKPGLLAEPKFLPAASK